MEVCLAVCPEQSCKQQFLQVVFRHFSFSLLKIIKGQTVIESLQKQYNRIKNGIIQSES